ncbi:MAG: hypothetical protein P8Z00_01660 [Anaerolineales bacterium]|jgi:hypothetical protein
MYTAKVRLAIQCALLTTLTLFGGILLGIVAGNAVFNALPGHDLAHLSVVNVAVSAVPALAGLVLGSGLWGLLVGRLAQATNRRRMALAGLLGFAPATILLAIALQFLEPLVLKIAGDQYPIYRLFTFLFVPTAFLIAGISAWAIGLGLQGKQFAWTLLLRVGMIAGLAFLALNLLMESLGWRVGAPGAAERFTMLTVMFVGDLGAALAGGSALGWLLAEEYSAVAA